MLNTRYTKSWILARIVLPRTARIRRIDRSFGTKVRVCSLMEVAAVMIAMMMPTIILISRSGSAICTDS